MTLQAFLKTASVALFDERDWLASDSLSPFAWSDVFLREISSQHQQVLVHIWPMDSTVILGMLDKRLPHLADGLAYLEEQDYSPVVRNIGGLAVVADEGVLNFSLIFSQVGASIGIKEAYEWMLDLIRQILWDCPYPIEAYEISQSYCPGDYDLSVRGQKIAGLAQRRIKDGILVSIYLSVSGNQAQRGQLVRQFYQLGKQGQETSTSYPDVRPEAMTTLSDVYQRPWTVAEVCQRLLDFFRKHAQSVQDYSLTPLTLEAYQDFYQDMLKRNKEVLER